MKKRLKITLGLAILSQAAMALTEEPPQPTQVAVQITTGASLRKAAEIRTGIRDALSPATKGQAFTLVVLDQVPSGMPAIHLAITDLRVPPSGRYETRVNAVLSFNRLVSGHSIPVRTAECRTLYRNESRAQATALIRDAVAVVQSLAQDAHKEGAGSSFNPTWDLAPIAHEDAQEIDATKVQTLKPPPALNYPSEAKRRQIEGSVMMQVIADRSGQVLEARMKDGPEILATSALNYAMDLDFKLPSANPGKPLASFALTIRFRLPDLGRANKAVLEVVNGQTVDSALKPDLGAIHRVVAAMLDRQGVAVLQADDGDPELRHIQLKVESLVPRKGLHVVGVQARLAKYADRPIPGRQEPEYVPALHSSLVFGMRSPVWADPWTAQAAQDAVRMILMPPRREAETILHAQPFSELAAKVDFDFSQIKVKRQPPAPPYPTYAKAYRIQGTVVLEVTIDEEGKPLLATVLDGPPALMLTAVSYALDWDFEPASINGVPVRAKFRLTMPFRLR